MTPHYRSLAEEIIRMHDYDLHVTQRLAGTGELFDGYHREMEAVHIRNATRLENIIRQIGWPTRDKVGQQARDAAVIIAQHAISMPDFQRACLQYIKVAIDEGLEDKIQYALLYDRICFNERRPQRFGTQYDWDEKGLMSPWLIEHPDKVDDLRQEYGLNTIEEQTRAIRQSVTDTGEKPPANYEARQQEIYNWSKTTGWIKS